MNGFCGGYDILTASQKMKECSKNKKKNGEEHSRQREQKNKGTEIEADYGHF